MQSINAENYRGTRLSLSGYLKTQEAGRAQLWMRVDGSDRRVLSLACGAAMLAGAIALFAYPPDLADVWPWPLTPLLAMSEEERIALFS